MKILADSNVFIDFWKNPSQEMIDTFTKEDVVICGVIRSELLHGARSLTDLVRIEEALDEFEDLSFSESDWRMLGRQLYELRTSGITVPFQDAIIAYLAVKNEIPLWTNDKHFAMIRRVMKTLRLIQI